MNHCTPDPAARLPDELLELMQQVGPRWAASGAVASNIALMCDAFGPVLARAPKAGVSVVVDLAYGTDPRQVLDVYHAPSVPAPDARGKPVLVFLHCGAFVDGHRNKTSEIYSNVLYYFARNGFVGINMEYRLAPASAYPGGTVDVAQAIEWVANNAHEFGGSAQRIFLMGHSSGGAHAASYAFDRDFHSINGSGIKGLIIVSGRVRADVDPRNPNANKVRSYYGNDEQLLEARSPVSKAQDVQIPTFIAFAEFENPLIDVHCLELASKIASATGKSPRLLYMRGHNHTSIIAHINTCDDSLGSEIRAFVQDNLISANEI